MLLQDVTFLNFCGDVSLGVFFHLRCGLSVGTGGGKCKGF